MNKFDYVLTKEKIDTFTTKKAKKEMLATLMHYNDYFSFKALTYLLLVNPDMNLGTQQGARVTAKLSRLLEDKSIDIEDLTEFCNSDFTISEFHFNKLMTSRYTTFQILAYAAKHITKG